MPTLTLLTLAFFFTALIYSSVGFGGGSTYLALLVLWGTSYQAMPQVALVCNLVVVTGALYQYVRAGHFSLARALPFVATSVPCAYLGGFLLIGKKIFLILLAISLGIAGITLLFSKSKQKGNPAAFQISSWKMGLPLGALLGFVSGLIGIGGGIFLSPILFLIRWGDARQIAAMASFFIFINSLAGLSGQFSKSGFLPEVSIILPLALAVFAGGQIGSRLSVGKLSLIGIQRITAVLVLYAAAQMTWKIL